MNSVVPATPAGLCIHRENFIGVTINFVSLCQPWTHLNFVQSTDLG